MLESFQYLIKIIMDEKNRRQKEIEKIDKKYIAEINNLNLKILEYENADIIKNDNEKEDFDEIKIELETYKENNEKLKNDDNNLKELCDRIYSNEKKNKKLYKDLSKEANKLNQTIIKQNSTINWLSIDNTNLNNKVSKLLSENYELKKKRTIF